MVLKVDDGNRVSWRWESQSHRGAYCQARLLSINHRSCSVANSRFDFVANNTIYFIANSKFHSVESRTSALPKDQGIRSGGYIARKCRARSPRH